MRPGLALLGAVLLVLALAAVVLVTFSPAGARVTQSVWTIPPEGLLPGATNFALLPGSNTTQGTITLTWSASIPTSVRLYESPGCRAASLSCAQGTPARAWSAVRSGNWSTSGNLVFPFLVVWNTSAPLGGSWGLTAVETVTTSLAPPIWQTLVIDAAGAALAIVGAVALFLGLFLRGGAFAGPAPLVSRSAEDAEEIAGGPRPPK